ncbi:hypothetical protein L1887_44467 [Cichorium endivia]|nr:hypothetical protein L1887_44467 [Cichorium endivia]
MAFSSLLRSTNTSRLFSINPPPTISNPHDRAIERPLFDVDFISISPEDDRLLNATLLHLISMLNAQCSMLVTTMRSQSAAYGTELKGRGCGPQHGQRFSLPWSRSILDVNIDVFEQKPWKHPGADITDYFIVKEELVLDVIGLSKIIPMARLAFPEENNSSLKKIAKLEDPSEFSRLGLVAEKFLVENWTCMSRLLLIQAQ